MEFKDEPAQPPVCLLSREKKTLSPAALYKPDGKIFAHYSRGKATVQESLPSVCRQKATALKGDTGGVPSYPQRRHVGPVSCSPTCVNGICARNDTQVSSSYLFWSQDYSRCLSRRPARSDFKTHSALETPCECFFKQDYAIRASKHMATKLAD